VRRGGVRPNAGVAAGVVLGFAGVVLLVTQGDLAGGHALNLIGVIVLLCSSLSWSVGSLYSHYAKMPDSPVLGTGMEMLAGGVLLLIAGVVSGEWRELNPAQISLSSALALGYLIIFGSFVTFTAFNWLLRTVAPARVATYAYVNPVIAVFLGWAIAGESLTLQTLLSTAIIVIAVAIIIAFRARGAGKANARLIEEEILAVDDAIGAIHEGTADTTT
jgi:drug/metabolite transporter (DMT)-like permease